MRKIAVSILISTICIVADAQWECPSRLGGALKQIGSSNFMWSGEITASGGWIKDNYATNAMGFFGLDYTSGSNTFYVEGGVKAWMRGTDRELSYSDDAGSTVTHRKDNTNSVLLGLREAFYKYSGANNTIVLGLQSAHGDDQYLLNERVLGANYTLRTGKIKLNVVEGTVMQHFARNGRFCTLGYLYNDIVVGRPRSFVGNDFGDTNFGMATLSYIPEKGDDGFDMDGGSVFSFDKIGAAVYGEFGRKINKPLLSTGVYSDLSIAGIQFKPEIIMQFAKNNRAVIYDLTAEKMFNWSASQTTRMYARYLGYSSIDKDARPINSFSNIFMGDVLRQDVLETPVVMLGIKHSFTSIKTSIKIQGVIQTKASSMGGYYGFVTDDYSSPLTKMKELDFGVSKNFGKVLLVNAMFGMLDYPNLEETESVLHYNEVQTMFGRLEFRLTF